MIHRRKFITLSTTGTLLISCGALSASSLLNPQKAQTLKVLYPHPIKLVVGGNFEKAKHLVDHCNLHERQIEIVATIGSQTKAIDGVKHFQSVSTFIESGIIVDVAFLLGQKFDETSQAQLLNHSCEIWLDRPATLCLEKQHILEKVAMQNDKKLWFVYLHEDKLNFSENCIRSV
jgi:hypothetical protein